MPRCRAVVFDLDDTLYLERSYVGSGFSFVARTFADRLGDRAATVPRMWQLFDSASRSRVFDALLTERGINDAALTVAMVDAYRTHHPTIALCPDADLLLKSLPGRYKLALLTDGRSSTQRNKIDALGLAGRLDEILVSSELSPTIAKPDPRPFDYLSTRLQTLPTHTVYVADNPAKDFIAPNALGWLTVRILRPEGLYRDAPAHRDGMPRHTIESLDGLEPLL